MKKILIAVDPFHLNTSTLAFGCYLARLTNSAVTGVFLENLEADREAVIVEGNGQTYVDYKINMESAPVKEKIKLIEEKIHQFKSYFDNHCVVNNIHIDKGVPIEEIIKETRYSDLLIIDAEAGFSPDNKSVPGSFARKMLTETECPVVIAPLTFEGIDEIIFAYNGSLSCMNAIKHFADIFPELHNLPVTVVEVYEGEDEPALFGKQLKEWMEARFSDIHYVLLSGPKESQLLAYLIEKHKSFIVMGAYGRNAISNFFRKSTGDVVVKTSSQPIFIAHH